MKNILNFLSLYLIVLVSCQKEINIENKVTPTPTNLLDSNYITEIKWTDSTTSRNVIKSQKFQYDNFKRLTKSIFIDNVYKDTLEYSFYYSSNDTLPNKLVLIDSKNTGNNSNVDEKDTTITYYLFDQNGKRIKDSILNINHDITINNTLSYTVWLSVVKYTYSLNKIFGAYRDSSLINNMGTPNYPANIRYDTAILDANQNILYANYRSLSNGSSSDYFENMSFKYDNHPSPFTRFSKFRPQYIPFNTDYLTYAKTWCTYNLIKEDIYSGYIGQASNYTIFDFSNLYEYNLNNYPKQINSNYMSGVYVFFKYTSL